MAKTDRWSRFGWHGVTFEVPEDWALARFDGTRRKGYARLVDREMVRVELRWDRPKRQGDFPGRADRVTADLSRRQKVDVERHTGLAELDGKDVETFTCRPATKGEPSSYTMLSACRECGRVAVLRVVYQTGENIKAVAQRLMGSFEDHSYDGADVWAAHGLEFAVPETMHLDRTLIYPGSADFRFARRRDRIDVGRIGVASLILEHTSLADWFRSFARKRFRPIGYECREAEVKRHRGLEITGRLKGLGALVPRLLFRQRYLCRLWHCEVSDKLYFFSVLAREPEVERLAAYCDRLRCH